MPMSRKVAEEKLPRLRPRYMGRGREGRKRMIDEVSEPWGYSRKHTIKLLGAQAGWGGDPAVREGRPPKYGSEVVKLLWRIRKVASRIRWLLLGLAATITLVFTLGGVAPGGGGFRAGFLPRLDAARGRALGFGDDPHACRVHPGHGSVLVVGPAWSEGPAPQAGTS